MLGHLVVVARIGLRRGAGPSDYRACCIPASNSRVILAAPRAFCHPQDVIDRVLQQVEAVDTAKNALAVALHWFEELVVNLARVSMEHARTL